MELPRLKIILILLLLLVTIEGRTVISTCGQLGPDNVIPFLANAIRTSHWPWHAAIYHRMDNSGSNYVCGGTVISRKSILTAGHCVSNDNELIDAEKVSVMLGRLNLLASESSAQSFTASKIIVHQHYSSINYANDIAIIRISPGAIFNAYVQPICLWKSGNVEVSELIGKLGKVVGWGVTENGRVSNVLQIASLPVVRWDICLQSNFGSFGRYLSLLNFCAGHQNGTSVCTGDSGGSMTFEIDGIHYIRGIVSVGASRPNPITQQLECDYMSYALFTDVAKYLQWIRENTIFECETKVLCDWSVANSCSVNLDVAHNTQTCAIIFDELSNKAVTELIITGKSDVIPELSDSVTKFENLKDLKLGSMELKFVDRSRLAAFRKIGSLDLSENEIYQVDADVFDDLKNLKHLNLYHNNLKEVPTDIFKALENLEELSLSYTDIETLPPSLFQNNKYLQKLDLFDNELKELPSDIFKKLVNLETLSLKRNKLKTLPSSLFQNNKNIQKLDLYENQLKELSADLFNGLENLKELRIHINELESLPTSLFQRNKNIQSLGLTQNNLKELSADIFKALENLEHINLGYNKLDSVPSSLFQSNKKIQTILLSTNQLKELPANLFKGLRNLKSLYLNNNNFKTLPTSLFQDNYQIQELYIEDNILEELHADIFKGLQEVENISLGSNQLTILPRNLFSSNQKLKEINLSNNRITIIQSDFHNLPNLGQLYLKGNVCIDQDLYSWATSLIEMDKLIKQLCSF